MSTIGEARSRSLKPLLFLLALIVPALVAYDLYFQWQIPSIDLDLDPRSGEVLRVERDTYGDYAGFHSGDLLLSIEGSPFAEWKVTEPGLYQVLVHRDGQRLVLELPVVPQARINALSLVVASVVALVYWGVGLLLVVRRSEREEVRLLFLLAQAFAVLQLFTLAHPGETLVPRWALLLSYASFYVAAPLLVHLYLTFPVRLGSPRARRRALLLLYSVSALALVAYLTGSPLRRLSIFVVVLEVALALALLFYVYLRHATLDQRRRLRLVLTGNVVAGIPGLLLYILPLLFDRPPLLPEWAVALCLLAAPLSYLVAVARERLFEIDRFLNRATVYFFLSFAIFAIYIGPFLLLYRLAPGDLLAHTLVVTWLSLLLGLGFNWAREQVQRWVDRLFYGGWYDYPGVVERISDALAVCLERQDLRDVLTRQVPRLMQLQGAELQIGEPGFGSSTPSRSSLSFPLTFRDGLRARWCVGLRRDGDELSEVDRRILKTVARQAEVALGNVLLVEELRQRLAEVREAQRRLLRSREEERARLARDLHDGPIQLLVGLNLQLRLLLNEVEGHLQTEGTPSFLQELDGVRLEVRHLLSDLRHVCTELRPPMLDALGLGATLRVLAEEWSAQSHVPVALDLPTAAACRSLPDEVAVNLYRMAQEALTNVARHAQAQRVTLRLRASEPDACVVLSVEDDGCGFTVPPQLRTLLADEHFGLCGIQERVDLIGGELQVISAPGGGTTVSVAWWPETPSV
ncbi:MAG: sensor histidine kinase [Anaerolineales bacterium]